jgi:hypothetical protein
MRTFGSSGPSGPAGRDAPLNEERRPRARAATSFENISNSSRRGYSADFFPTQVVRLGLVDADLLRKVKLLGHLGAARVLADADANFLIRSWLDTRIGEELARRSSYEGEP